MRTITQDFVGDTAEGVWKSTDNEPFIPTLLDQYGSGSDGVFQVTVTVTDVDDQTSIGVDTLTMFVGKPAAPELISPLDRTSNVATLVTFEWGGVGLADSYLLEIAPGGFDAPSGTIIERTPAHQGQTVDAPQSVGQQLVAGTLYEWRVRGETNAGVEGDFSPRAAFITAGNPTNLILEVSLQGTGTIVGEVVFNVDRYLSDAFGPDIEDRPWLLISKGTPEPAIVLDVEAQPGDQRDFQILLADVPLGFFDITVGANHTLINLRDDVGVAQNTGPVDMGTLLERNAADDDPAIEPASVINALDASVLAAAINNQQFDADADFNRDGLVDPRTGVQPDLDLLKPNYFQFSPCILGTGRPCGG